MSSFAVTDARKMARAGAYPDEEELLNPFKNRMKKVWNAETLAEKWREAFLDECHEVMIRNAEDDADEALHS